MLYWRKHRYANVQANVIFRPAFLRNWRLMMQYPMTAVGVIGLKALETGAVTLTITGLLLRRQQE